jgi:hypothetical protein
MATGPAEYEGVQVGFETEMVMEEGAGRIVWGGNSWELPRWLNFWQYLAKFLAMFWCLSISFCLFVRQIELPCVLYV